MKKITALLSLLTVLVSLTFADIHPRYRNVEFGFDASLSAQQNLLTVNEIMKETIDLDFTRIADDLGKKDFSFSLNSSADAFLDVKIGFLSFGIYVNLLDVTTGFSLSNAFFDLLGHGNKLDKEMDFYMGARMEVYSDFYMPVGVDLGRVKKMEGSSPVKNKITALQNKLNSVSANYQTTGNDMVTTLLPKDEVAKLKEEATKLKNSKKDAVEVNIDIAEDGTVALTKSLKSDPSILKNLTAAKKAALQRDLNALASEKSSYNQIASQAKDLIASIKAEPATAAKLTPELLSLAKTSKESLKQVKNITNLTSTLTTSLANAGVKLK